jgi:clostripain
MPIVKEYRFMRIVLVMMTLLLPLFAGCDSGGGGGGGGDEDLVFTTVDINNVWYMYSNDTEQDKFYRFPVTAGVTYNIYMIDEYYNDALGISSLTDMTGDMVFDVYFNETETSLFSTNGAYDPPRQYEAVQDGFVYIKARPVLHSINNAGTFRLKVAICPTTIDIDGDTVLFTGKTIQLTSSILPSAAVTDLYWPIPQPTNLLDSYEDGFLCAADEGSVTVTAESLIDETVTDSIVITTQLSNLTLDADWEIFTKTAGNKDTWLTVDVTAGREYAISCDYIMNGSGDHKAYVSITGYQSDRTTQVFIGGGYYISPNTFTAPVTGKIYLKVTRSNLSSEGDTFALKIRENVEPVKSETWTVMMYMDGDNDLESELLSDISEVKRGLQDNSVNVICLMDRISGESYDSLILGSNFNDARLFRLMPDDYWKLNGGTQFPTMTTTTGVELNMGDPANLQKFIQYCKENYPADHYVLVMSNHGGGVRSRALGGGDPSQDGSTRAICYDDSSSGDCLYTAEITDVLTSAESVDLLVLDACLMGNLEVAYQYRPGTGDFSADFMVSSSPLVWGYGLDYEAVFERIVDGATGDNGETAQITGGMESLYDPDTMTVQQFGGLFIEEQRDSVEFNGAYDDESMALLDLSKAAEVQTALNTLAVELASHDTIPTATMNNFQSVIFGSGSTLATLNYFNEASYSDWISNPHVDLYAMANRLYSGSGTHDDVKTAAGTLRTAAADMVIYSYGGSDYGGFVSGTNGLGLFCPFGNMAVNIDSDGLADDGPAFAYQWWYTSLDTTTAPGFGAAYKYGKLASCAAGATVDNNTVENWFELLDYWYDLRDYDGDTVEEGGLNSYLY